MAKQVETKGVKVVGNHNSATKPFHGRFFPDTGKMYLFSDKDRNLVTPTMAFKSACGPKPKADWVKPDAKRAGPFDFKCGAVNGWIHWRTDEPFKAHGVKVPENTLLTDLLANSNSDTAGASLLERKSRGEREPVKSKGKGKGKPSKPTGRKAIIPARRKVA